MRNWVTALLRCCIPIAMAVDMVQGAPRVGLITNAATGDTKPFEIAQGSLFVVNVTNLSAGDAQAKGFPVPTELAGVSIRVTVGDTTHSAMLLRVGSMASVPGTSSGYLKAVLPSGTPLGQGMLTVTYNGETSLPVSVRVVRRAFGMFTTYRPDYRFQATLVATVQNVNSEGDQPLNTVMNSARPGQIAILWGTGLGPVAGDERLQPTPGDLRTGIEVLVGNQIARVLYAGRSGCCAGVDQILFETPAGIHGCSVPIAVRFPDSDVGLNMGTMSISPDGGICSDPYGLSAADRERLRTTGSLLAASFNIGFDGRAEFYRLNGDPVAFGGSPPPLGTCLAGGFGSPYPEGPVLTAYIWPLNAGPFLTVTGPQRTAQWTLGFFNSIDFIYYAERPVERSPGEYLIDNGRAGRDIGPFRGAFTLQPFYFRWNNGWELADSTLEQLINRPRGLTFTWEADPSTDYVVMRAADEYGVFTFTCTESADKGRFTVPAHVLQILRSRLSEPITWEVDFSVIGRSFRRFAIPGLDRAEFEYWAVDSAAIFFR